MITAPPALIFLAQLQPVKRASLCCAPRLCRAHRTDLQAHGGRIRDAMWACMSATLGARCRCGAKHISPGASHRPTQRLIQTKLALPNTTGLVIRWELII